MNVFARLLVYGICCANSYTCASVMLVCKLPITTLGFLYITPRMENESLNVNDADSVATDSAVAAPEIKMP